MLGATGSVGRASGLRCRAGANFTRTELAQPAAALGGGCVASAGSSSTLVCMRASAPQAQAQIRASCAEDSR